MANLSTTYLGLKLDNPIVIGSSGLSNSSDGVKKLADNGAGAVVLKSIFEEQIDFEANKTIKDDVSAYPEAADYIRNYTKSENVKTYINIIEEAKKNVSIPVIASINCFSASEWTSFAKRIEDAGADALELNAFTLPSDEKVDSNENEKLPAFY